jgi:hypothetical protein
VPNAGKENDGGVGAAGAAAEGDGRPGRLVHQLGVYGVQKEGVLLQKVQPQDGEGDGGAEKFPREGKAAELEVQLLFAPAGDVAAVRADEARAAGGGRRRVRKEADGGAGVDEETPTRLLVCDVQQLPGGGGVEPRRAA